MIRNIVLMTLAGFLLLSGSLAHAQSMNKYSRRYEPKSPTLSPYLNYFRSDVGVVDRYNTFVRPRQQLRDELNRQDYRMQSLNNRIGSLNREVEQQIRQLKMAPTGTGSTFMNYSHYYNLGNRNLGNRQR